MNVVPYLFKDKDKQKAINTTLLFGVSPLVEQK